MIESVVLAVGPDNRNHVDALLNTVESIAGPAGATVYLVHVFTHDEYNDLMRQADADPKTDDIDPDELAANHDNVRTPASRLDELQIDYEIRGVVGYPNREVVEIANQLEVDMLFIGGRGRSPTKKAVFGDYAQQVLLNADCPVTYVQQE
ncbi:universal stress protein [Haloarcula nitratireducens]|uniref:Universal stress protein n=1 Tax=Haloarcula nitratireducens TaxID=2487749 RepID=A0AAW4PGL4_9EURY|nr:universal stress protein [Halomicroarcula nitratireducens]MBX0296887.1 universal stress protein [Halomicroarcula nitratireducens]